MSDIKLIIAMHKPYSIPEDKIYLPLFVGAAGKESFRDIARDDEGINISAKNYCFCELTGLYWAWKNLDYDYLGLVHYRRHFANSSNPFISKKKNIMTGAKLEKILQKNPVVLPKKRHYFIETTRNQYLHSHHHEGLLNTEKVIKEKYSDYMPAWEKVMNKRSGHRFNMFIMRKDLADAYCEWVFDILFEVEKMTDISGWDKTEQRIFGYLSERMLDVWILKNNINFKEQKYLFLENQNWFKKGFNFLKRFFTKGKYKE